MAIVDIFQWNGTRHYCSACGTEGIPRSCRCRAHVEDWYVWVTITDITLGAWWPTVRLERLADAERVFRS